MDTRSIVAPRKLIEVALPLDEINKAAAREKCIRHGHPSTLHLWWARRPLASARAVIFAQMVNDPAWKYSAEELKKPQVKSAITRKRNELFQLITELVQWENTNNQEVLGKARAAIRESWRETCEANKDHPDPVVRKLFDRNKLPPFHDPFAGGGSIPLEAQRLGLEAHASDLNPVAVLINKAMIEIPPKFAGRPPVGPIPPGEKQTKAKEAEDWSGTRGLAEDVRRYGAWMREEAWKRIGHLYPKVKITKEMAEERPDLKKYEGQELVVIAWLWARTVASPNPASNGAYVPLVSSWVLSKKPGKETWIEPVIKANTFRLRIRVLSNGQKRPPNADEGTKQGRGANFRCLLSGVPISGEYIKSEGKEKRLQTRLIAIVCEGKGARVYLDPTPEHEQLAESATPKWCPTQDQPNDPRNFWTVGYGLRKFADLFTKRQQTILSTLTDLIAEVRQSAIRSAGDVNWEDDNKRGLEQGGVGAIAYGDAIATYLSFAIDRSADFWSTIATWSNDPKNEIVGHTFGRQAIPMTWDFGEINPFSQSGGNFTGNLEYCLKAMLQLPAIGGGTARQSDATLSMATNAIVSTDPPYFDNVNYSDLSDFFYVWMRPALRTVHPDLLSTILTPKKDELIADPYRHGSKGEAEQFFMNGMSKFLGVASDRSFPSYPMSLYYAFKQSETNEMGTTSSGWESFLAALCNAGLQITSTWPMRTERPQGLKTGVNALASSIILSASRRRLPDEQISRREFLRELERAVPLSLAEMTADPIASIAPVDLAQASIGPGMAIFSKYKAVLEADGSPMSVHNALVHINKAIDSYFAQAEGEMDADTRFCIDWFQQYGFEPGPFGTADVLARAKGTAVDGVRDAGVLESAKGKVRLLRVKEYPAGWDPGTDTRTPIWEACHQMCRALSESEHDAGVLLARMAEKQDAIRQLAYRLYTVCERKRWAEEARAYNELVTSWPAIIEQSANEVPRGAQLDFSLNLAPSTNQGKGKQ